MEKLKDTSGKITALFSSDLTWSFDDRFNTALMTLDAATAELNKEKITSIFENCYDLKTKKKALKTEQMLMKTLDGINNQQLLFTSAENDIILYCAFWPWGDKSKVSLRFGLFPADKSLSDEKCRQVIQEWFNLK